MNAEYARKIAHRVNAPKHQSVLDEVLRKIDSAAHKGEYKIEIDGTLLDNRCYESPLPKFVVESLRDEGFVVNADLAVFNSISW